MRFLPLLLLVCVSLAAHWQPREPKDGIELFSREVPGSDIIALKGTGTIDAPLWKVAAILLDTERAPEWVDSLEKSSVVKRLNLNTYIEYNHIGTPFFMQDRDFVSRVEIQVNPRDKTFALHYEPSDVTVPTRNHTRGVIQPGLFHLRALDAEHTLLTGEVHCDPRGSLPKWLVNFFQSDWAYETIEALRRQVRKPDIRTPPEFADVLLPTRSF